MEGKLIAFILAGVVIGAAVGVGVGYLLWDDNGVDGEEYNFYLYFADGDEKNGWYSGTATNTNDAFSKAMEKAGFEWSHNEYGYLSEIDDVDAFWMTYLYLYVETDADAAANSVLYPVNDSYGGISSSNGWSSAAGYDTAGVDFKMSEFGSKVYFISTGATPVSAQDWMTSGPFAA